MTTLHVYFTLRNQQAFQRLLDASRAASTQAASGSTLSSSGGRSWNKPSPLSGGNGPAVSCDVNARDWLGRTVLHLAVSSLDPAALEFVKLLLTHPRINVNLADTESRWTPLHRALYVGNITACVLLLQRTDIDVSLKDFEGYTAFDIYNSTVEGTKPNGSEVSNLFTWGTNRNAALGVGDGDDRVFPELVSITSQKDHPEPFKLSLRDRFQPIHARQIGMAKLHTAVVTSEPRANMRVCGFGSGGRLGAGVAQHTQYALSSLKDLSSEAQIVAVALGQDHTLALTSVGDVLSWGLARFSQLGYALDGGLTLQAAPRRIVGPLKREIVTGIVACRTASACWTENELFTWGTNCGQLGYDRIGTPVQIIPRRVTQIALPVIDVALSDTAMVALLANRDVQCFYAGRSFKVNFPTQNFPSEIQAYRPPMAQNNASIAKVVSCENTFAALSSNGEVFTFTLNSPPTTPIANPAAAPSKTVGMTLVKPQRVWALRKQFSAVKDVALSSEGTIILCTESGHVYVRSRTNKTSKFTRIPLVQRAVAVSASSAGAFGILKAECAPTPIYLKGNSIAGDMDMIQPYFAVSVGEKWREERAFTNPGLIAPPSSGGDANISGSPLVEAGAEDSDDLEDASIKKDIETVTRLTDLIVCDARQRKARNETSFKFEGVPLNYGADFIVKVDSGFEFPVHRVILVARSEVLKDVLLGQTVKDSDGRLRLQLAKTKPNSSKSTMMASGVHPLSALMLAVYLYTDEIPAIWDRRVTLDVIEKLANCVPKTNATDVHTELQKLAVLLRLPALADSLSSPVKRSPAERLAHDMKALFDDAQQKEWVPTSSCLPHPCAPDTVLQLADAQVQCHSTILRARSPFFAGFFDDPDWTAKRRRPDCALVVNLRHMHWRVMEFVMRFIYAGGGEEIFDVLEFAQTADDVLEFLFEVIDVAGELLLDRLLLICSSVILQFLNINNACSILSDASHFNAGQLIASVQGYLARNAETLLESRMLDDLPTHLIRDLSAFVRARQAEKLPVTRSAKLIEKALETWKDWLALQDIPQTVAPARKGASGQIRQSPKLSPIATASSAKRNRRLSIGSVSASCSPPLEHRLALTPPSAPIHEGTETGPDDIFVMDDVREEIPHLSLPAAQTGSSASTSKNQLSSASATFSPWKARISQLSSSKLDLRAIMAEAEGQREASRPSTTPPGRIIGFDLPVLGSSTSAPRIPQKVNPAQGILESKMGSGSPWRLPKADLVSGPGPLPTMSTPTLMRKSLDTPPSMPPSGVSRDLRENQLPRGRGTTALTSSSSTPAGQVALGKGKAPLGPTFAPTRQSAPVSAAPIARRISEGSSKAWAAASSPIPLEPKQAVAASSSSTPPLSFLAIQQQQRDQNSSPARIKKSLLEIQEEEQARAADERALQEEIDFMRWWAAEEERIRRETQARPGPPISGPVGDSKNGRRAKGAKKKASPSFKKHVPARALTPGQPKGDTGNDGKERDAVDGQQPTKSRRLKEKALK